MKKLIALAVGTLSLFAFTACEDDNSSNNNGGDNIENPNANKTSINCLGSDGDTIRLVFNSEEITSMTNITTGFEYSEDYVSSTNAEVVHTIRTEGPLLSTDPEYDKVKYYMENAYSESITYVCE